MVPYTGLNKEEREWTGLEGQIYLGSEKGVSFFIKEREFSDIIISTLKMYLKPGLEIRRLLNRLTDMSVK